MKFSKASRMNSLLKIGTDTILNTHLERSLSICLISKEQRMCSKLTVHKSSRKQKSRIDKEKGIIEIRVRTSDWE